VKCGPCFKGEVVGVERLECQFELKLVQTWSQHYGRSERWAFVPFTSSLGNQYKELAGSMFEPGRNTAEEKLYCEMEGYWKNMLTRGVRCLGLKRNVIKSYFSPPEVVFAYPDEIHVWCRERIRTQMRMMECINILQGKAKDVKFGDDFYQGVMVPLFVIVDLVDRYRDEARRCLDEIMLQIPDVYMEGEAKYVAEVGGKSGLKAAIDAMVCRSSNVSGAFRAVSTVASRLQQDPSVSHVIRWFALTRAFRAKRCAMMAGLIASYNVDCIHYKRRWWHKGADYLWEDQACGFPSNRAGNLLDSYVVEALGGGKVTLKQARVVARSAAENLGSFYSDRSLFLSRVNFAIGVCCAVNGVGQDF